MNWTFSGSSSFSEGIKIGVDRRPLWRQDNWTSQNGDFFLKISAGKCSTTPEMTFSKKVANLACPVVFPLQGPPVNTYLYTLREGWTPCKISTMFLFMKLKISLKDIIRLYNIKDFIKLFKCSLTLGTLHTLYRLFFLTSIAQFFTQIYTDCFLVHKLNKLGKFR